MRGWREKVERDELLGDVRDVVPESFLFLLFLAWCLCVGPSPSQTSWSFKDSVSDSGSEGNAIDN